MKILNNLNRKIDHTLLKANALETDIERLCQEARDYHFASVCINPIWVNLASGLLKGSDTRVCTVIGFPLGAGHTQVKCLEADLAVQNGAHELDMVMNLGYFKDKQYNYVLEEIQHIKKCCSHHILKVIIETVFLEDTEKRMAVDICYDAGADFVKTSTGFATGGATVHDIEVLKKQAPENLLIKASGGIRSLDTAIAMLEAGADRLGSSSSVAIMKEFENIRI